MNEIKIYNTSFKNKINELLFDIGFILICFFTFIFPLKFALPYTYNIDFTIPQNFLEIILFSWPNEWGYFILSALFIIFIILNIKSNTDRILIKSNKFDLIILIWIFSVFIIFLFHGISSEGLQIILQYLSYVFYYFSLKIFLNSERKRDIIIIILFSSLIVTAGYGFYQFYEGLDDTLKEAGKLNLSELQNPNLLTRLKGKKIFSTFIYSNSYAGYLIIILPFLWKILLNDKKRKLTLYSLIIGGLTFFFLISIIKSVKSFFVYFPFILILPFSSYYLLILTRSKGAILIFSITAIFTILYYFLNQSKIKLKKPFLVIITFFILLLSTLVIYKYKSKFLASFSVRNEYNKASVKMFSDNFFIGIGFGKYGSYYTKYKTLNAEEVQLAHNTYLQMFAEGGVICGVLFLLIIIYPYYILLKKRNTFNIFLLSIFINMTLHNFIDFDFHVPGVGFLMFYFFFYISLNDSEIESNINLKYKYLIIFLGFIGMFFYTFLNLKILKSLNYSEIGRRYKEENMMEKAMTFFILSAKEYPFIARNFIDIAIVCELRGDFDRAEEAYEKALKISPENSVIWRKYARCLFNNDIRKNFNRKDKILNALNKAYNNYPSNKDIMKEIIWFKNFSNQDFNKRNLTNAKSSSN